MTEARISNFAAVTSIIVSTLGSGITLLPSVFNKFGTLPSLGLMSFVGLITYISLYSLAYAAEATNSKVDKNSSFSYEGIAASFSKKLSFCVSAALVLSSLSTAFSFVQTLMVLILQTIGFNQSIYNYLSLGKESEQSLLVMTLVRFGILAILALIYFRLFKLDSLSSLNIFSTLSLLCCIIFSCVTFAYGIFSPYDSKYLPENITLPKAAESGTVVGFIIFALHCQFSFPGILSNMKDQSLSNFRKVSLIATVLATILYSSVGYFGCKAFKELAGSGSIVLAFGDQTSSLAKFLKNRFETAPYFGVYLPRAIHTAYIPIFFSGIIFNIFGIVPILQNFKKINGKPISRSTVALILAIGVVLSGIKKVSDLDFVFGVIGFLFVTPLSFLFPAIFVILCSKQLSLMKSVSYSMTALSAVIMIGLLIDTVQKELVKSKGGKN